MYASQVLNGTIGNEHTIGKWNIFSSLHDWEKDMLTPRIHLHSGRTDDRGGHHDWLNKEGNGFGAYHYHHGEPAHLHPDGKCPYKNYTANIVNPYTYRKIELSTPYNYEDVQYFSLNAISKALTMDEQQNVVLDKDETSGTFYACPDGNSASGGDVDTRISFAYPKGVFGIKDNTFFKTDNEEMQLLCHTKKDPNDSIKCYAYVSLDEISRYMSTKGYFTGLFADENDAGTWKFNVRKVTIQILQPRSGDVFHVGDEVVVKARIENVSRAALLVDLPSAGFHTGYAQSKKNLDGQTEITFDKFKLTDDLIPIYGAISSYDRLAIKVNGHTGGTTVDAEGDSHFSEEVMTIYIEPQIITNIRSVSQNGIKFICEEELTNSYAKNHGLLAIDSSGTEIGIYPHYVAASGSGGNSADGVITVGYGITIPSQSSTLGNHQALIAKYNLSGKKFDVKTTSDFSNFYGQNVIAYKASTGASSQVPFPVRVPNTKYATFLDSYSDFGAILNEYETYLNDYLNRFGIVITKQHHYDALLSLCYNTSSWTFDTNPNSYVFTNLLIVGGEVNANLIAIEIASWRSNPVRRQREADLFENAIYNPPR